MSNTPKVALITGAARRVGAETARTFHAAGFNIALHYHQSAVEAKQLCAELNVLRPHSAIALCADLANIADAEKMIHAAANEWQRLDVLVNNASRFTKTHIGNVSERAWQDLFDSNLKAPFFLSQTAAPYLVKQQGCIVNIADVHGERPMRDYAVYCMTKAGLIMMTRALAKELGPAIRVNAVSPGAVAWPEGENVINDQGKQKIINRTALQREGGANDIAKAVLFLAQNADYITGQVLSVDGGRLLSI